MIDPISPNHAVGRRCIFRHSLLLISSTFPSKRVYVEPEASTAITGKSGGALISTVLIPILIVDFVVVQTYLFPRGGVSLMIYLLNFSFFFLWGCGIELSLFTAQTMAHRLIVGRPAQRQSRIYVTWYNTPGTWYTNILPSWSIEKRKRTRPLTGPCVQKIDLPGIRVAIHECRGPPPPLPPLFYIGWVGVG